jgi:pimeloyl-ACP methyl ester carboxylesterase
LNVEPFDVGGLHGHRGGTGTPALLLHGGPAIPDYMGECAERLDGLFATIRYTQRGTPPSKAEPPYTIEAHMADALAVLDAFELDRAWAIGHSWGGHLALHLLVAHPERLLGVLCIGTLGADGVVFAEFEANLMRRMTDDEVARIRHAEQRRREGEVTEAELVERFALEWPHFFVQKERAIPPPARMGAQCSIEANRSLSEHFARGTLVSELPYAQLPARFVHGDGDPLPLRTATETAALIPGRRVEVVAKADTSPGSSSRRRFALRSSDYSASGSGRPATGDEWMSDVVVRPYGVKRSRIGSRSSIERRCSFRKKQSSPVIRWHSTTSGVSRATSRILSSWRDAGATRTTAARG